MTCEKEREALIKVIAAATGKDAKELEEFSVEQLRKIAELVDGVLIPYEE